jgi:hypothetical protein
MLIGVDVPGGQDVRQIAAKRLVDSDITARGLDPDLGGADQVGVAGPADREENHVQLESTGLRAGPVVHGRALGVGFQSFDLRRSQDGDAGVTKSLVERVRHLVVSVRHQPRSGLDQAGVDAEVRQDRRELAAGVGAPDDRRRRR